ncbi:MAG: hypothetical protein IPL49_16215 [Saprospirales bacterium]|nr:hypothetical protein [Saprospirales bacterium]
MTTQDIQKLLDKYFEGETSLEEEASLKRYFQGKDVDPSFRAFQPLFQFLESEREASLSPSFETRILTQIQAENRLRMRRITIYIARVAAIAVMIIGIVVLFPKQPHMNDSIAINWAQYEPQTDEEAMAETTAALQLLASKLNGSARTATKELDQIKRSASVFK